MPTKLGPKKPSTSYFLYMADVREKAKAENPEASTTQLSIMLGQRWRELPAEEKKVYEQRAAKDKERYKKEDAIWRRDHPEEVAQVEAEKAGKRKDKKKRGQREEGAPKRALTAYIFFTNKHREETKKANPEASITDLSKLMGAKWKSLTDAEKEPYQKMAEKDKVRYKKEKATWDAEQIEAKRAATEQAAQQQAYQQQMYAQQQYYAAQQQYMQQPVIVTDESYNSGGYAGGGMGWWQ